MTYTQSETPAQNSRGLAIGALAAGLLALVFLVALLVAVGGMTPLVVGSILGVVAVVLGILALKRGQPRTFAISGIVAGALAIVLGVGLLLFALAFVGALGI